MAGIGVKLNKIYDRHTITTTVIGMGYSTMVTITPMLLVIIAVVIMQRLLGFASLTYVRREIFSSTILYIFIFALLTTSILNSVISKLVSDVIFEENFEDIMPCYYTGLIINVLLAAVTGILFCIHAVKAGGIETGYVCVMFLCYIMLVFLFYTMTYLSLCKSYEKIMIFYTIGMVACVLISVLLRYVIGIEVITSMLLAIMAGFMITGSLGFALLRQYFPKCSNDYMRLFVYMRRYWKLIPANFLYTLGLYIHNFVFWISDLSITVVDTFVYAGQYDLASCLAMFTNISASVIFISNVEMHFRECYKNFSESIIGGRYQDIEKAKGRMFRRLVSELMNVTRVQFIISIVIFLICSIFLPRLGFNGLVMSIYPAMAAGYFVVFIMYAAFIFLYYYDDMTGAMLTSMIFCAGTLTGSVFASMFEALWYGTGIFIGALLGWAFAYYRLHWIEKNIDEHIFCRGDILKRRKEKRPSAISYKKSVSGMETKI